MKDAVSPDERVREAVLLEEKVAIDTKRVESKYDKKSVTTASLLTIIQVKILSFSCVPWVYIPEVRIDKPVATSLLMNL